MIIKIDPTKLPAPVYPQFTSLQFLDLLTEAEQLAIVQAGMQNAAVKLWYDRAGTGRAVHHAGRPAHRSGTGCPGCNGAADCRAQG